VRTRAPAKFFVRGQRVEFRLAGCPWRGGKYLNPYDNWHIVEERSGNRLAVLDCHIRNLKKKACATPWRPHS
jgi:hypothetical protein